ncbi:hypothetical protein ACZ76_15940 [Yersinia aleksiciae]|uniref:Uncharacterized protein n=1 Tax=Yersinia aleksiciae TaxID=263819 RepID=A0ABM5UGF5_YERAE|nr:hypothetical protein ACZ76_15940 [Yersinia aleksiciae]
MPFRKKGIFIALFISINIVYAKDYRAGERLSSPEFKEKFDNTNKSQDKKSYGVLTHGDYYL